MIKQTVEEDGWTRLNCGYCNEDKGYDLFLHNDYGSNTILSVCKNCGKIYFCESKADIGAA